jgi:hypothetical protein
MYLTQFDLFLGWAAYLSAVATFITLVTGILFFTLGEPFGKINDTASVFQMLFMLPIAAALFLLTRLNVTGLALLATAIGIIGMLIAATLQTLLVFGAVDYEQTITAVLTAGGAVGLWLLLTNFLAFAAKTLPGSLAIFGIVAGMGYILLVPGFHIGRQQHPLFYTGTFLAVFGYLIWATWLGRLFLSGRLAVSS